MRAIQKSPGNRAFGILEALLSVTVIGLFAGAGLVLINGAAKNAKERKLELDVATINAGLSTFVANGGDLTGANTAAQVIARLKTRAADSQADGLVGIKAGFLDLRITPVVQSTAQAATSEPRVLWDAGRGRFVLRHSGAVGFREFVLDDSKAGEEDPEYARHLRVEYSKKGDGKWVWDYAEHNNTNSSGPINLLPIGDLVQAGTPGTSSGLQLNPPTVSLPGGDYALLDYDGLEVTVTDPNPAGASELFYSVVPGIWERYEGPVSIDPGMDLQTQTVTIDPENWANSVTTLDEYRTTPLQLDLAVAFANLSYDYVSLGGTLESGSYSELALVQPGALSLTNGAGIPSQYLNSGAFNVYWTTDGSDPRTAPGAHSGDAFSGGFAQEIPLMIDDWGSGDTLELKAYAKSHNAAVVTSSELVSETLTATKIGLRPPVVVLSPSATAPQAYDATIALQTDYGDMPLGARIFYTTDGSDPGFDAGGEPAGGTLYAGSFQVLAGDVVNARVFPPVLYGQWFVPSGLATESPPAAPAVPVFPTNAILSQDSISRLYSIQVDAATSQGSYSAISGPNPQNQQYNAIGYRQADGMLYGMNPQSGQLLKVDPATGDASVAASLGITSAYAGDFNTGNGLYYFKRSSESKLYVVDVDAGAVVQQIDITPTVGSIGDITYNAADGNLYSYYNKQLYAIDPTTGVTTVHPAHAENPDGHAGASFADGGNVFIALNTGGLYWIDTSEGIAHWIADSPSSSLNDGALLGSGGAAPSGGGGSAEPPTVVLSESFEGTSPGIWSNGFFAWETEADFSNSDQAQIPGAGSQYAAVYSSGGLTQATVDLPGLLTASQQAAVAGGAAVWEFSGWLAGWGHDSSVAVLSVEWFDGSAATGVSLGTSILADGSSAANVAAVVNGNILENDAANWNQDNWSQYVSSGAIPAGAQSFVMTYAVNPGGDGYADLLSFSISEGS